MNETIEKIDEKRYRTTERHELLCRLNDEELLVKGAELADWMAEKRRADQAKSIAAAQAKEADEKIDQLATTLRYKQETRTVECVKVLDFATGEAIVRRPVDGSHEAAELVYRRPLNYAERQLPLPGLEDPEEEDDDPTPTEGTDPEHE